MELQLAEGKIMLTFILSKFFVKFFVCVFLSPTLLFFFFLFFFFLRLCVFWYIVIFFFFF